MTERPGSVAAITTCRSAARAKLEMMGAPVFIPLSQKIREHFEARGLLD